MTSACHAQVSVSSKRRSGTPTSSIHQRSRFATRQLHTFAGERVFADGDLEVPLAAAVAIDAFDSW
jgi:hypothetical protein